MGNRYAVPESYGGVYNNQVGWIRQGDVDRSQGYYDTDGRWHSGTSYQHPNAEPASYSPVPNNGGSHLPQSREEELRDRARDKDCFGTRACLQKQVTHAEKCEAMAQANTGASDIAFAEAFGGGGTVAAEFGLGRAFFASPAARLLALDSVRWAAIAQISSIGMRVEGCVADYSGGE